MKLAFPEIPVIPSPMPPIAIHCDSQSAIELCKHESTNVKMNKHMWICHKSVWRHLKHNVVSSEYIKSELNLADCLIKELRNR